MAELKSLYESLGFENVVTYIQSGNVVFDSDIEDRESLKLRTEAAIEERFNFRVPVIIRSHDEIENIVNNSPFGEIDTAKEGTRILVTFLSDIPSKNAISSIQDSVVEPEQLVVNGMEVHLHCPNGYGRSKLSNNFIENKLGVEATTRNWKTVVKLFELSGYDGS